MIGCVKGNLFEKIPGKLLEGPVKNFKNYSVRMKRGQARKFKNLEDGVISSRAANSGRFNDRAPGPLIWGEDTVYSYVKSISIKDIKDIEISLNSYSITPTVSNQDFIFSIHPGTPKTESETYYIKDIDPFTEAPIYRQTSVNVYKGMNNTVIKDPSGRESSYSSDRIYLTLNIKQTKTSKNFLIQS